MKKAQPLKQDHAMTIFLSRLDGRSGSQGCLSPGKASFVQDTGSGVFLIYAGPHDPLRAYPIV